MEEDLVEITYKNPYPNEFLLTLDGIALKLIKVYRKIFDTFLGCLFHTTKELQQPWKLLPVYLILLPLCICGLIVAFPYLVIVVAFWYSFQWMKQPFRVSTSNAKAADTSTIKSTYNFMTTNLCLLPESVAKFNNLDDSSGRSTEIGRVMVNARETPNQTTTNGYHGNLTNGNLMNGNNNKPKVQTTPFDVSVVAGIDPPDFLLIQEGSWVLEFGVLLGKELHKVYPHVVYDVGIYSFRGNLCLAPSGMMFASKYPVLDIQFRQYKDSCRQCVLASKGLLHVKVHLGKNSNDQRVVGYVFNTHLQAYQGTKPTQSRQMDEAIIWSRQYRMKMTEPDEVVAFDVFGGDLNLDNISPVDQKSTNHDLFREYKDAARLYPGRDQDWAVGTEMRQRLIYEPEISTPAGLQRALEDPILLQTYILDADVVTATPELGHLQAARDAHGNVIPSKVGGKRRIDYLLFKEDDGVEVTRYDFVCQLAMLTDHIPVHMELRLASHKL